MRRLALVILACASACASGDSSPCPGGVMRVQGMCPPPPCLLDSDCAAGQTCDQDTKLCVDGMTDAGVPDATPVADGGGDASVIVDAGEEVDAGPPPMASVPLYEVPERLTVGSTVTFQIGMQNDGAAPWPSDGFRMAAIHDPPGLWGPDFVSIPDGQMVEPGRFVIFQFEVVAPPRPGRFPSRWRMEQPGGVGRFGDIAESTVVVTTCGNGTVDVDQGEDCDDGAMENGDGCSDVCLFETFEIDLSMLDGNRTFLPEVGGSGLASVASGVLTEPSVVTIAVADRGNATGVAGGDRVAAGRVHLYNVGPGFFALRTRTTVPTDAAVTILGAAGGDQLGGGRTAGVLVGDVTGDAVSDLVVAASGARGMGRAGAGVVYVFSGGPNLDDRRWIDLADTNPSPSLRARIVGPNAGSAVRLLAVGDLDGDGADEIVVGAPEEDSRGTDSGTVYVVRGGRDLTGVVDLGDISQRAIVAVIYGENAGDRLGERAAAVGNVGGGPEPDLFVGSARHGQPGLPLQGAVWGMFGPVEGVYSLNLAQQSTKIVGNADDRIGQAIVIANVTGDASQDLVVGNPEFGGQQTTRGVVDVWQGPLTEVEYDLETGVMPTVRITGADTLDRTGGLLRVGDVNGDAFADIAIGSSGADGPMNGVDLAGEVVVVAGRASLPASIELAAFDVAIRVHGAAMGDRISVDPWNLSFTDLDGDGKDDLCVGAGRSNDGRVDCVLTPF